MQHQDIERQMRELGETIEDKKRELKRLEESELKRVSDKVKEKERELRRYEALKAEFGKLQAEQQTLEGEVRNRTQELANLGRQFEQAQRDLRKFAA